MQIINQERSISNNVDENDTDRVKDGDANGGTVVIL